MIKPAACDKKFFKHKGPAIVFNSYPEMKEMIDRDDFEVTEDHIYIESLEYFELDISPFLHT